MPAPAPKPAAEVDVDAPLVARLLAEQHPDLAHLPLEPVGSGWDNALVRVGDGLVARLPRRAVAAEVVAHEHRWLPELAPTLPLPVPVPVRTGRPGAGYPWPWSLCRWEPGVVAAADPAFDPLVAARHLGAFLAALHVPAPLDAPRNPFRGVPLADRVERFEDHLGLVAAIVDAAALRACWADALAAPPWDHPAVWVHGDLHPANLVVHDGRLAAVLDFGDLTAGDPATDLAVAWMLLPAAARPALRAAAGAGAAIDDATWARARGWAVALGLACLAGAADEPLISRIGRRTMTAVLADPAAPAGSGPWSLSAQDGSGGARPVPPDDR
jgi:aminoglycoside phosphotransferase (APT) family kinase protein